MSALVTVRFPSGTTEFRMRDNPPEVGDVFRKDGREWIVDEIARADDGSSLVTLRAAIEPLASSPDEEWPGPLREVPPPFAS